MDPVVHFEMPYEDPARVARFYRAAFGWKTKALGEESGRYVLATTNERGPRRAGSINGGFFPRKPRWPAQVPAVVIAVEDLGRSSRKIAEAGGKVIGEPMEIPGVGQYVSFVDPEGNRVSLLQPQRMKPRRRRATARRRTR